MVANSKRVAEGLTLAKSLKEQSLLKTKHIQMTAKINHSKAITKN